MQKTNLKLLGVDPGLHNLGWAVIELTDDDQSISVAHGLITTNPKVDTNQRLYEIQTQLSEVVSSFELNGIGLETPFIHKGMKANLNFIKAYGVIATTCKGFGVEIYEIAPAKVKKVMGVGGRANKSAVSIMVNLLISGIPSAISHHEFDAYAIAYCCGLVIGNKKFL